MLLFEARYSITFRIWSVGPTKQYKISEILVGGPTKKKGTLKIRPTI